MGEKYKKNNGAVAIFAGCLALVAIEKRFHLGPVTMLIGAAAGVLTYIVLNKLHKEE